MSAPSLTVFRLPHGDGLDLPAYETEGAAGMDLRAAVPQANPVTIAPGARALLPTGWIIAVPGGYEAQVRPRSGLALRHGVTCLNTPGTIDGDYRGEVKVLIVNLGEMPFTVTRGMRIAQMVVAPVVRLPVAETADPPGSTERGAGGFGSTGTD